jgi:alpha-beta hydrolase superfamily lysophospholipase
MMMKSIFKRSKQLAVIVLAVIVTIFVLGAFDARRMPGLELWHTAELKSEFTADESKSNITFQTYLENEERLFQELQRKIADNAPNTAEYQLSRYFPNGLNNPETFPKNWNRSFERIPPEIRGGAILLHGLTDSPYSLRKAAEILVSQHIYVLGLRLLGHGTIPAGIDAVRWQDWLAAVHIGVRQVIHQTGDQKPFFMVGYSNGAALAIKYTLDALEDASLVVPDQLVLFSPAVAITPLAVFADWHKFISFVPFFEKFKWTAIELEYDPYKYISFPKNAGKQTYLLTRAVQRQIKTLKQEGKLSRFPSEIIQRLEEKDQLPYDLTIVTNVSDDSPEVIARTRKSATSEITEIPLGLRWPTGIFSLSHIAIPFSPDDLIYGRISRSSPESGMNLGTLEPRGERGVLRVSLSHFMRLRYNPFFPYIEKRMVENIRRHTAKGDS